MRRAWNPISVAVALFSAAATSLACGLHDGMGDELRIQHPRSFEVAFALYDAGEAGLIDRTALAPPAPGPLAYLRATNRLRSLHRLLADARVDAPMSILLADAGLWTHVTPGAQGLELALHVDGPRAGDAVIVTTEPALAAVLEQIVDARTALARRLFVVEGAEPVQAAVARAIGLAA